MQDASSPLVPLPARAARRRPQGFGDLLERARGGDERAWAELYERYAAPVRGYVAMRGAADPDDLVGEVFVQLARGLHRFSGTEAEFRSWVFMVAHNRVVDERRRAGRRPALAVAEHDEAAMPPGRAAEAEALDALGLDRVRALLETLTPDQRSVLLLRFVADLSLEEIAVALDRPVGAVKQLQRRALRSLKRRLVADVPN